MTRNAPGRHGLTRLCGLSLAAIVLLLLLAGCSANAQRAPLAGSPATPAIQPAPVLSTPSLQPPALRGPINFLIVTPLTFSSVNGAAMDDRGTVTPLDARTVKTEITGELKRLLFVVDSSDNVEVYSPGAAPVKAQTTINADGSATIAYIQTVDSEAGTIAIAFQGTLRKDQITITYQQRYTPSMLINANASEVAVALTTRVRWATADQIPAAPRSGAYQLASDGGVALSWSAGQNAVAYDVYRLISDHDQQFQFLTTVKGTVYIDDSPEARQNVRSTKGITYAIFSVGPTGIENPGGIVIPIATS